MSALTKERIEECAAEIANERMVYSDDEWRIRQECAEKVRELASFAQSATRRTAGEMFPKYDADFQAWFRANHSDHIGFGLCKGDLQDAWRAAKAAPAAQSEAREPVAWISYDVVTKQERIERLPIQSMQPNRFKHTPLYAAPQTPSMEELPPELAQCALDECHSLAVWFKDAGHDPDAPTLVSLEVIRKALKLASWPQIFPHEWDSDGERCLKCGQKDWMAGGCRPPMNLSRPADDNSPSELDIDPTTHPSYTSVGATCERVCNPKLGYFQADHLGGGWVCTDPNCPKQKK